ncbi:unnamed protein product [Brassicogethes aeneus]|uniref:Essential protein Yae1 N-terminal domain-containing protein n=1 Tax=Brassicogethes aeneus TaxID=1431903 RepID=A0A9P0FE51_BRAAE|nr:unnamed protein product [Brassicogethes aeneus]
MEDVTELSWKKIERKAEKCGYRDGINDGRKSNFQKSFDQGYKEGFKNGYAIGKYKGALMATYKQTNKEDLKDPLLEKISRGWCQVCPSKDTSNLDINEAISNQNKTSNNYLKGLHEKYKDKVKIKLPQTT